MSMARILSLFWPLIGFSSWLGGSALALPSEQIALAPDGIADFGASPLGNVRDALIASQIIPTVIDDFQPSFLLTAEWKKKHASLGNLLKVKRVKKQPIFSLALSPDVPSTQCGSNMTYTITLTDPDAPSRSNPKWSEMCHFIATGLALSPPGAQGCSELMLSGLEDVIPYKPPGPPPKTGRHRYVFLVFAPANGTTEPLHLTKPNDRQHWGGKEGHGVRDWAHDNGLVPVAANFIYAQNKKQ
ncbi:phosphatidylethanolamine-binding protein [Paramyrothecium foliicola]|nr:phosphatidylethanolamine-binding protein [Paramyrothecium foliicola]